MIRKRIDEILDLLLDLPASAREARLRALCGDDDAAARTVASLIEAFEASPTFLSAPREDREPMPERLGRYRIREEIGRGGSGVVYLAEDPDLGRLVAIKILKGAGAARFAERLRAEARALASITQPNVAAVYTAENVPRDEADAPSSRTELVLTMEYVPGSTLGERLRRGSLPVEEALDCARQVAAGLEAAHERGVVHRDLNPQNVRITPGGWIKIIDFGLAAREEPCEVPSDSIAGTPGYMSPEQIEGRGVSSRTDLWALGAILFECLSGSPLVPGETVEEILANTRRLEPAWDCLPPLTERVRLLLRACLEPDVDRRTSSATIVRRTIEEELLRLRASRLVEAGSRSGKGNLPATWSGFVGRQRVLEEVARRAGRAPLLTLTGPGGVGKTRTALEAAARIRDDFEDGAWFVDLSEIADGADLPLAVARALALTDVRAKAAAHAIEETIADALSGRDALLVLDNCEHVLDEAARFCSRMLERCPRVRLLATSRAPLGLPGERTIAVAPLELPAREDDAATARERDAVRLFESRARLRDPTFVLDGARLGIAVEICRRLDGLPLAIELAAGQVRLMPLEEIHRAITSRGSLAVRATGRPRRHRSMTSLVDWSYRLLRSEEQRLFARLAVFRGGWTLEAAEAICAGEGLAPWQACEAMSRLVEQSLVEMEPEKAGPGGDDPPRYRFLETIRGVAGALLDREPPERASVESRYVEHLAAFAHARAGEFGLTSPHWAHRVELDYANFQHALEIAVARRLDTAVRLGAELGRYWAHAGYWAEGLAWLERIVAAWRAEAPVVTRTVDGAAMTTVLGDAARLAARLEQGERSRELASASIALAREIGDPTNLASALRTGGGAAWFRVELDAAEACWTEALGIYRTMGNRRGIAICSGNLGGVSWFRGDYAAAEKHFRELEAESAATGDSTGYARATLNLGRSALALGRAEEALVKLEHALELHREAKDPFSVALALHGLGDVHVALGEPERARRCLVESAHLREEIGQRGAICEVLVSLSRVAELTGDRAQAVALLRGVRRAFEGGTPHFELTRRDAEAGLARLEPALSAEALAEATGVAERLSIRELVDWAAHPN